MMFALQKRLMKAAHTILRVHRDLKLKDKHQLEIYARKYGAVVLERDFERWCLDVKAGGMRAPTFPVSEYLKIIESRMEGKS
jgi:hypothetical protein